MTRLVVDLGGTAIKRAVVSGAALEVAPEVPVGDAADLLPRLADLLRSDLPGTGSPGTGPPGTGSSSGRPDAVALAVPGVVDAAGRRLVRANAKYTELIGFDLAGWAEDTLDAPALVENDARAALLGEVTAGCAQDTHDAVAITLGTGIGTAAMINGDLLRGRHGHAGILGGHLTLDLTADRCPCGNVGCAESLASSWSLAPSGGLQAVINSADHDPAAATTLAHCVAVWGASIVSLCHAYDPEVVVVTGGVMRAADRLLAPLTTWVHEHLWSSSHRPELRTPTQPDRSVLLGLDALATATEQRSRSHP